MTKLDFIDALRAHESILKVYSGLVIGTVLQLIYSNKKTTIKLSITTILSSMFLFCYIIEPILKYIGEGNNESVHIFLASISGLLSVISITIIIEWLPSQLKEKVRDFMGLKTNNETNRYYEEEEFNDNGENK